MRIFNFYLRTNISAKTKSGFLLILAILLLAGNSVFAQQNFFTAIAPDGDAAGIRNLQKVSNKSLYRLDEQAMRSYLHNAQMEFRSNSFLPLKIPLPNGKTEIFNIVESPILSPDIAAAHPEIKTYTGNGQNDKRSVIRLSLTSSGFNAIILNVEGDAVYFESYSPSQPNVYFNYFARDAVVPQSGSTRPGRCGQELLNRTVQGYTPPTPLQNNRVSSGATLTTYRLAMAADAEFTAKHGGTAASGFNAIVSYVNRITAFYRNELSVSFTLVSGTNLVYTTPGTPYNNGDQIMMLTQNQTNCDAVIGSANYDIAHVWGYEGGSGGGIANSPALCDNATKAQGVSGEGDPTQYAQVFFDQLVFHEMGHQFGMSHSYNSVIPVCTTRNGPTSVEPGAGATVMSYGFTCGSDDYFTTAPPQTGPILQFHTASYSQAIAYMATVSCGVTTATGNIPPVVVMPPNYTIPKSTPFALTGSATDGNGDALTYCWEGTNIGTITPDPTTISNTAQPPFSRSYSPVTTTTRTYPLLSAILDGSNYAKGDKLSSVSIATTHRLTVRDNNAVGGGVTFGSVTVTVDGSIGPFLETTNLAGTYAGNSAQTITWSVNGTAATTPAVKISFSSDGGLTFPTTLLASTPNDGSETITLPNVSTTTARIKVEAVGNIFFDISNSNFSVTSTLPVQLSDFSVTLQRKRDALLTWKTASENKTKGFEIEMSNDNVTYRQIVFVAGKGTTSQASNYQYTVPDLSPGLYYFRLKILDIDGNYTYSPIRTLKILSDDLVNVYPNPSKDSWVKIELQGSANQKVNIRIINGVGQLISNADFNYNSPLNIKVPGGAGIYYFEITPNNGTTVFKKVITLK